MFKILCFTLFVVLAIFSVMDTDSLISPALETFATNPPDVGAIFQL